MFWILLGLGGVVSFVALTVLVLWVLGGRLPEAHEASVSARVATPPEVLFEFVTDRSRLTEWRADLRTVEPIDAVDGKPAWREFGKFGEMELCLEEALPPTTVAEGRYVTRIVKNKGPFGGTWTWIFAPDGDGNTRLTITERGVITSRPIRALAHHFMGLDATVHAVLNAAIAFAPRR